MILQWLMKLRCNESMSIVKAADFEVLTSTQVAKTLANVGDVFVATPPPPPPNSRSTEVNTGLKFNVPKNVIGRFEVDSVMLEYVRPLKQIYSWKDLNAPNGIIIKVICTRDESIFEGDPIGEFVFEEIIQNLLEKVDVGKVNNGFIPVDEIVEKKKYTPYDTKSQTAYLKRRANGERNDLYFYKKMNEKLVLFKVT